MRDVSALPTVFVTSVIKNRSLIIALIMRDVIGRYRGSALGLLWSLFNPVLMLMVYTFVFSVVFKARWMGGDESRGEFALVLFAGLIIFNVFSECFTRAPSLIVANVNYVKKIIFPLEVLPLVSLGSALFHAAINLGVWLVFWMILQDAPPITIILLPVITLPLILLTLGTGWLLASVGVYLRDVGQVVGLISTVLMFLSPIFYPTSAIPDRFRLLLYINPLVPIIDAARDIMIWGKMPDWEIYSFSLIVSLIISVLGFAWFQKTRKGFADVL